MSALREQVVAGGVPAVAGARWAKGARWRKRVTGTVRADVSWWWSASLIFVLAATLWLPRLLGPIDLRYDGGVYYSLGTSLSSGAGYRILSEPGAPEGIQYPPGLPLLIAAHQVLLDTADPEIVAPWLRKTFAGLFLAFAFATLALARRFLPPVLALAATALCLLQVNTYLVSDLLFTEIPFALVSVLFLLVLGQPASRPPLREAASFALATVAFFLRTAGIALLAAWVLEALVNRRWRLALLRLGLALAPVLLWQAHVMRVRGSEGYQNPAYEYQRAPYQYSNVTYGENMRLVDPFRPELGAVDFSALWQRAAANLAVLPVALGEAVSEPVGFWRWALRGAPEPPAEQRSLAHQLFRAPLVFLSLLVVAGLFTLARRRAWGLVLYAALSVGLVCTTPWPSQFARYLTPLIPLLTIAAILGAVWLEAALRRCGNGGVFTLGRVALAGFLAVVLAVQGFTAMQVFRGRHLEPATLVPGASPLAHRLFYFDRRWVEWEKAAAWLAMRAAPGAVVATTSPHLLHLRTGLPAVLPPMEADATEARRLLASVPVSYVIVDELEFIDASVRYALPAVAGDPAQWRLVHRVGGVRIYQHAGGRPPAVTVQ